MIRSTGSSPGRSAGFIGKNSRRGSMMVEMTIILPVFIVSAISLGFLIKGIMMQMMVNESLLNTGRAISMEAVATGTAVPYTPLHGTLIRNGLEDNGVDGSSATSIKPEPVLYSASGKGTTDNSEIRKGSMKVNLTCNMDMNLPGSSLSSVTLGSAMEFHQWTGLTFEGEVTPFTEMEDDGSGELVYIFPAEGECYHQRSCRVLNPHYSIVRLNENVKARYGACPLCIKNKVSADEQLAVFDNGSCYHRLSCQAVNKRYVSMSVNDAAARGYRACSICGG